MHGLFDPIKLRGGISQMSEEISQVQSRSQHLMYFLQGLLSELGCYKVIKNRPVAKHEGLTQAA